MKTTPSIRQILLVAAILGVAALLASPARRAQLAGLIGGKGGNQPVVLFMGRSWSDTGGAAHGAFTILNEGTTPISVVTVRCAALDDKGRTLVDRTKTLEAPGPIAPGGRTPFEMTVDVMSQTFSRMDCEVTHAR